MTLTPADIWAAADYAPTAKRLAPASTVLAQVIAELPLGSRVADIGAGHGHTSRALLDIGARVTAIEPVERMRLEGMRRVPQAQWVNATGEDTGLPGGEFDAVASSFGTMFCDPEAGPAEWARILRPGGVLAMTVWNEHGFLAEMTDRMVAATNPGAPTRPPHMLWGEAEVARERLDGAFVDLTLEQHTLPWCFDSVEHGMELYLHGSPTHTFSLAAAGERANDLLAALRGHLQEHADDDGRIRAQTGYTVLTARRV